MVESSWNDFPEAADLISTKTDENIRMLNNRHYIFHKNQILIVKPAFISVVFPICQQHQQYWFSICVATSTNL